MKTRNVSISFLKMFKLLCGNRLFSFLRKKTHWETIENIFVDFTCFFNTPGDSWIGISCTIFRKNTPISCKMWQLSEISITRSYLVIHQVSPQSSLVTLSVKCTYKLSPIFVQSSLLRVRTLPYPTPPRTLLTNQPSHFQINWTTRWSSNERRPSTRTNPNPS